MLGEILAITAAVSWALSSISLRRALQTSSPLTTAFASVAVNAIVLWPVAIMLTPFSRVGLEGIIPLLFAGLMAPSLARLLQFMAVDRLGVALSTPLIETMPLFGAVFAVSILHEEITIPIGIGITIVVLGVMILGSRESVKLTRTGVVLALLSAVLFAGADIGRKIGIILVSSPFLGAAVGATVGIAAYFLFSIVTKTPIASPKKWTRFDYLTGILTGVGIASVFSALFVEKVVVVQPLQSTTPLFALFFTWVFLRRLENVTASTCLAAILIVIGSILVAIG